MKYRNLIYGIIITPLFIAILCWPLFIILFIRVCTKKNK